MRDLYSIISNEVSSIKSFKSKHTNLTMTANFPDLTHYDANLKTSNCFMIAHNDKKYLVSTTHTIMDSWKSTDSVIASSIRCMKTKLTNYVYSRFFDVVIFDVTDNDKFKNVVPIDEFNIEKATSANVSFMDVSSDMETSIFAKYMNNISSSMEMDAVSHHLPAGSSGCAVVDTANNLLGMITSMGENYENMTLVVPAKTIHRIIETADFSKSNYDSYASNYPKIIAMPLQRGHLEYLSVDKGEFVVVSDDTTIVKPFDIITKVNNTHNRLATEAHLNDKVMVDIMRLKPKWRNLYGALPRKIVYYKENDNTFISPEINYFPGDYIYNGKVLNFKNTIKIPYIKKGMNIKIHLSDSEKFVTITEVNGQSVTCNVDLPENINSITLFPLSTVYCENASNNVNGIYDIANIFFNENECTDCDMITETCFCGRLSDNGYKYFVAYSLVKHWAFLVTSSLTLLPIGQQHIVWAKMVQQLLDIVSGEMNNFDLVMIILYKLIEFNDINAMNLLNILLQNIYSRNEEDTSNGYDNINSMINDLKIYFPIIDNTNNLSSSINIYGKEFNYTNVDDVFIYNGAIGSTDKATFEIVNNNTDDKILTVRMLTGTISTNDSFTVEGNSYSINSDITDVMLTDNINGDSTFNADGFSSEHYHMKNTISKAQMRTVNQDNVNREIELVLNEIKKVKSTDFSKVEYYYPPFFSLLKSFWDHAHLTLGGIMETLTDDMFETVSDINLPLGVLPSYMSTWGMKSVRQQGYCSSWICTYLHNRGMLTDSEYMKFNKFGLYAFKHHSSIMMGYWSYLEQLMEHFSNIASEEEWNHFKPWIVETIQMIDNGEMEDAYDNFCKKVIYLTENYNTNYFLFDNKQKDIYSGIYQKYVINEAIKQ